MITSAYEREVHIFGHDGATIAELAWPDGRVVGALDWTDSRLLVIQRPQPMAISAKGGSALSIPVGDGMTILQALSIRWTPNDTPMLAVVSRAASDVPRFRIEIRDSAMDVVYDEVLDSAPRLMVVIDSAGNATLLISDRGLSALNRVRQ